MSIKRYVADLDNTIVNAFQPNMSTRGTGSNSGQADIVEVYSVFARQQNSSSATTGSQELSRVLMRFPVSNISNDRSNSKIPASGSVSFYLRLYDAKTSKTVPKNYSLVVQAISRSWEEGDGLDLEKARQKNRVGLRMCDAWTNIPQITVASINGACIGGGVSLALSCDFRFCAPSSYFYVPEIELGFTYAWGTIPKLESIIGPSKAKLLTIACKKINTDTLLEWGLCEEVSDNPLSTSIDFLKKINQDMNNNSL